jgi:hypothetical protein
MFPAGDGSPPAALAERARVRAGTVLHVSPQVLVIGHGQAEERLALPATVTVWRGGLVPPAALREGEPVVVRLPPGRPTVAGKIWASIGRVTGTIVANTPDGLLVDEGTTSSPQVVVVPGQAANRIRVRIPQLGQGNLIDVIGVRRGGVLEAHLPATAQPAYLAGRRRRLPVSSRRKVSPISGCVVWHERAGDGPAAEGAAYPAIDPSAGCAERAPDGRTGAVMPYLAPGSLLLVRNDCTGDSRLLPVTCCAAVATRFHDRCVACGTSPRGRIAELTMASFVALGGELEQGCFNGTIETGW